MSSIFLCHSSTDKPFVRMLKRQLLNYGVRVWLDEDEIKIGDSLISTISEAIVEMGYLGVVLSPKSVRSPWVKEELELALNQQLAESQIRVMPILLRKCDVPGFLKGKRYINFTAWASRRSTRQQELESSIRELVRALGKRPSFDDERFHGQRMIKIEDFERILRAHFHPLKCKIEYYWQYVDKVCVFYEDGTFQLFSNRSRPSDAAE